MKHTISLANVTYYKVSSINKTTGLVTVLDSGISGFDSALQVLNRFENNHKSGKLEFALESYKGHYSRMA